MERRSQRPASPESRKRGNKGKNMSTASSTIVTRLMNAKVTPAIEVDKGFNGQNDEGDGSTRLDLTPDMLLTRSLSPSIWLPSTESMAISKSA